MAELKQRNLFNGSTNKRYKSRQQLLEQIHFMQNLIDAIPSPVFYKDRAGIYQGCNKAFEAYVGVSQEELIGKSVYDLSPPDLAEKYAQMDNVLFEQGGSQVYESNVVYADGSSRDVIFNKALYYNSLDQLSGLVGVITNITERKRAETLERVSAARLQQVVDQIVRTMSTVTETRDLYTAGHQRRVSQLAVGIAKELGLVTEMIDGIRNAALLHDTGKIAVPFEILTKPSKLTFHEMEIVKGHSDSGYEIFKNIEFPWPIAEIVRQHHERMDGSGYPQGLSGTDILLEARIIAVADIVEAMVSHRPYRPALGIVPAISEINRGRGTLYDETVVAACIRLFELGFSFQA